MKIILTNGTELSPIMVTGGPRYIQGFKRDTLNFIFSVNAGMEALDETFTEENCESITIVEDNGNENVHKGYTIRAELSKASVEIASETSETAAVYEDRITVSMSQRTYMESQLSAMQAAMAQLNS
jgi:hypothetical protein